MNQVTNSPGSIFSHNHKLAPLVTLAKFQLVNNAKTEAVELIKKLPDDATLEDIQHHLFVLEKIKQGQQRLVSEGGISQAVMEDHMALSRAHELDAGKVKPKTQTEVFQKARAVVLG